MDNHHRNRKLQPSIRPLRSQYRVYRDSSNGRTIYTPYNEMYGSDYLEFLTNIPTCFLLTFWLWEGLVKFIPFMNEAWIVFGMVWIGLSVWQNDSGLRWPLRFITWGIFWGMLFL